MIAAGVPYAESALLLNQKLPGASGGYMHPAMLCEHLRQYAQAYENLVFGEIFGADDRPDDNPFGVILVEEAMGPREVVLS